MLVASMNPCPCGYRGHPVRDCVCLPYQVQRYENKISGPLMDRIDIHLTVKPVDVEDLIPGTAATPLEESSEAIRRRVEKARALQTERFRPCRRYTPMPKSVWDAAGSMRTRSRLQDIPQASPGTAAPVCPRPPPHPAPGPYHSDLEGSPAIEIHHLAEAIQYR